MTRDLFRQMEATWPPARAWRAGPWMLRDGAGGGGRVSAATLEGAFDGAPPPLVHLCEGEEALDAALAEMGYRIDDTVILYHAATADLRGPSGARAIWPPSDVALAAWAASGKIGPSRLAVMERCARPKAVMERDGAAAFVAVTGDLAVLHALEVAPPRRRHGLARDLLRGAADWAAAQGASRLALAVSEDNAPARALYAAAGMVECGRYHYRRAP